MVFGQKQLFFVFEVFGQIQSGNIVSDVLDRKKILFRQEKPIFKQQKKFQEIKIFQRG